MKHHTLEEYMAKYGQAYNDGTLWDFSKEDLESGAIEKNPDMDYWLINGRYYEVPKEEK